MLKRMVGVNMRYKVSTECGVLLQISGLFEDLEHLAR